MTNDELLTTLRRWVAEANGGPWMLADLLIEYTSIKDRNGIEIAAFGTDVGADGDANARLATLAHELLPLVEALIWSERLRFEPSITCHACAALARLRERVAEMEKGLAL